MPPLPHLIYRFSYTPLMLRPIKTHPVMSADGLVSLIISAGALFAQSVEEFQNNPTDRDDDSVGAGVHLLI
jgi:hypothetical protein